MSFFKIRKSKTNFFSQTGLLIAFEPIDHLMPYERVQTISYDSSSKSQILTSNILKTIEAKKPDNFQAGLFYLFENLKMYKKMELLPGKQTITLKYDDLECKFSYKYTTNKNDAQ